MPLKIPYKNLKTYTFAEDKSFTLKSGEKFGPVTVAYETFGTLNEDKSNAILVMHALTGDSHVTSAFDDNNKTPGWWDTLIGKGKAIDTEKYFIICSNILGGCMGTSGPASINPETGKEYAHDFPLITVEDMVKAQKALIDHLRIKKLKAAIGGSLGGMNVLEWAVSYPDTLENAIVIASAYKTSPQVIGFYEVGRNAILADPNFNEGNYYGKNPPERGLTLARMIAHITYLSKAVMEEKFGRDLQKEINEGSALYGQFGPMFQVESYLRYQGSKFVTRFDANSYLYITKAMDMYDLTDDGKKDLAEVLSRIKARMLVMSFDTDWHFTPSDNWNIVKALMSKDKETTYVNIDSEFGHDAFLLKNEEMERIISSFIGIFEAKRDEK